MAGVTVICTGMRSGEKSGPKKT
jgi:hypothetical protein